MRFTFAFEVSAVVEFTTLPRSKIRQSYLAI